MKTALCLYGQPRNFHNNWPYLQHNIINNNSVDVFFHCWFDEKDLVVSGSTMSGKFLHPNLRNDLPLLTQSKKFIIESQKLFYQKIVELTDAQIDACWPNLYGNPSKTEFVKNMTKTQYSMMYSINQSILLKELYAQENQFEYDCVIVSRFDTSPKLPVMLHDLDMSKVTTCYGPLPRDEINDWFIIGNNKNMNIIGSIFLMLDYHRDNILKKGSMWTPEAYIREQTQLFNIAIDFKYYNITF
jgi:hypothetical protein